MTPGRIESLADARAYVVAAPVDGGARLTLVSKLSGERKTFRVRQTGNGAWFVDVLVGPDNAEDYRYIGFLYDLQRGPLRTHGLRFQQNKERWGNESFATFSWLVRMFNWGTGERAGAAQAQFAEQCELWHDGTCARCGRDLTTPESVARGLGPTCAEEMADA